MSRDKLEIVKGLDDGELIKNRYSLDTSPANINMMESQRRLKDSIIDLNKTTTRYNLDMIRLTKAIWALTFVNVVLMFVSVLTRC